MAGIEETNSSERKLQIEERRIALEEKRERRLQRERKRELDLAEQKEEPSPWYTALANPLFVAAFSGILALAGNAVVTSVKSRSELELANRKEQSELVLGALGTDNVETAKENLRLIAEAELITDPRRRKSILAYLESLEKGEGPGGLGAGTPSLSVGNRGLELANSFMERRRNRLFQRNLVAGKTAVAVIGDSWLSYPTSLQDIGDHLLRDFAVFSKANAGECIDGTLQNVIDSEPTEVEVVIVSVGLCELFGFDGIVLHLDRKSTGKPPVGDAAEKLFSQLEIQMATLVSTIQDFYPNSEIILHGYDYLPNNDGGGSISTALRYRGYGNEDSKSAIRAVIDRFNSIINSLAKERSQVKYIDLRGTLTANDWRDPMNPTGQGFQKLTEKIVPHLTKVDE